MNFLKKLGKFFIDLTVVGKIILIASVLVIGYFVVDLGIVRLPGHAAMASWVPKLGDLSNDLEGIMPEAQVKELPLPSSTPTSQGLPVKMEGMQWLGQTPLFYAMGDVTTTKGSLFEKAGINMSFFNENNTGKMQDDFLAFATALSKELPNNPKANPQVGTHFFSVMGGAGSTMVQGVVKSLEKLGLHPAFIPYSLGASYGEDKWIAATPEIKANPRGSFCAVCPRDDDQNIVFIKAKAMGVKVNTDSRYFDNDAVNFMEVDDFKIAAEKYIGRAKETRPEIKDGKPTGKKITKEIDSCGTWAPKDDDCFRQRGGVTVASTKDNKWQMAQMAIGVKEWMDAHPEFTDGYITANSAAADQVRKFPSALRFACDVQAKAYNLKDADYWMKLFKGVPYTDANGNKSVIGGSSVKNLADNLYMFGLLPNQQVNIYANTYTQLGNLMSQAYPKDFPVFPPIEQVLDLTRLRAMAVKNKDAASMASAVDAPSYDKSGEMTEVYAKTAYSTITFESGSAKLTPEGVSALDDVVANQMNMDKYMKVVGHTDRNGSDDYNMRLGMDRAQEVKRYIMAKAPGIFTDKRIDADSMGKRKPIPGASDYQNRRVEIIIGDKE